MGGAGVRTLDLILICYIVVYLKVLGCTDVVFRYTFG